MNTTHFYAEFEQAQARLHEARLGLARAKDAHAEAKEHLGVLGSRLKAELNEQFAASEERACWRCISYAFLQSDIDSAERYIELNTCSRSGRHDVHLSTDVLHIWEMCRSSYVPGLELAAVKMIYNTARARSLLIGS